MKLVHVSFRVYCWNQIILFVAVSLESGELYLIEHSFMMLLLQCLCLFPHIVHTFSQKHFFPIDTHTALFFLFSLFVCNAIQWAPFLLRRFSNARKYNVTISSTLYIGLENGYETAWRRRISRKAE